MAVLSLQSKSWLIAALLSPLTLTPVDDALTDKNN